MFLDYSIKFVYYSCFSLDSFVAFCWFINKYLFNDYYVPSSVLDPSF